MKKLCSDGAQISSMEVEPDLLHLRSTISFWSRVTSMYYTL